MDNFFRCLQKIKPLLYFVTGVVLLCWFVADTKLHQTFEIKWFPHNGWEPVSVFLMLLTGVAKLQSTINEEKQDAFLAKLFLSEFPSNRFSGPFLKEHDMGNSFHENKVKEIERFADTWVDADHEFNDRKIEILKEEFRTKCDDFYYELFKWAHPIETQKNLFKIDPGPEFRENRTILLATQKLNQDARQLYAMHQNLTRLLLKK